MPLKLTVGLTKKLGLPDYGSLGASCHVEVELDASLLQSDLDGFHQRVKNAFTACRQAVSDELSRQEGQRPQPPAENARGGHRAAPSRGHAANARSGTARRATAAQVRALESIARRQELDLDELIQERLGKSSAGELTISEASRLIEDLNHLTAAGAA